MWRFLLALFFCSWVVHCQISGTYTALSAPEVFPFELASVQSGPCSALLPGVALTYTFDNTTNLLTVDIYGYYQLHTQDPPNATCGNLTLTLTYVDSPSAGRLSIAYQEPGLSYCTQSGMAITAPDYCDYWYTLTEYITGYYEYMVQGKLLQMARLSAAKLAAEKLAAAAAADALHHHADNVTADHTSGFLNTLFDTLSRAWSFVLRYFLPYRTASAAASQAKEELAAASTDQNNNLKALIWGWDVLTLTYQSAIGPPKGACCAKQCWQFAGAVTNSTQACVHNTFGECLLLGPGYAWKGNGSTCVDGSCSGGCCCGITNSSCTSFPYGTTPDVCVQQCAGNQGTWYGDSNSYNCTGFNNTCNTCGVQKVFDKAIFYPVKSPAPAPMGLCTWAYCIIFDNAPNSGITTEPPNQPPNGQACFVSNQSTCIAANVSSGGGYAWRQTVQDCYSGYVRYYCQDPVTGSGTGICGTYSWPAAVSLDTTWGGPSYWYGDGFNPLCASPMPLGPYVCPTCNPFIPGGGTLPPAPTPDPFSSVAMPDFNATGACCKIGCSVASQDASGNGLLGCLQVSAAGCLQVQDQGYIWKGYGTNCEDGVSCTSGCCCQAGDGLCSKSSTPFSCQQLCKGIGLPGVFYGVDVYGQPRNPCGDQLHPLTCFSDPADLQCAPAPAPAPAPMTGACARFDCGETWDVNCVDFSSNENFTAAELCQQYADYRLGYDQGVFHWIGNNTRCDKDVVAGCCCASAFCEGIDITPVACAKYCGPMGRWYGYGNLAYCFLSVSDGCLRCPRDIVYTCGSGAGGTNWMDIVFSGANVALDCVASFISFDPSGCILSGLHDVLSWVQTGVDQNSAALQPPPPCPANFGFDYPPTIDPTPPVLRLPSPDDDL